MGACPSSPVCPTHNQCTFDANGSSFAFACGLDYSGGDIESVQTSSITDCISLCTTTPSCTAITFSDSACSLKNISATPTLNPTASAAYIYTYPSTSTSSLSEAIIPCPPFPKTNLLSNPSFEHRSLLNWTQSTTAPAREGIPSTSSPHTGSYAFIAAGGVTLAQKIPVLSRRSYTMGLWTKQTHERACECRVRWEGETKVRFTPGTEYGRRSVMFPVGEGAVEGSVEIGVECERSKGEVWIDDVSFEIGWAG
ncbi:hypothetical protein HBI57_170180 [Parastagonospora nodorum]|nr:hypothetical protein HBI57_170180 [Parastagonospora nodorum]